MCVLILSRDMKFVAVSVSCFSLCPPPTRKQGLWKQEDGHGNRFMVAVTPAPTHVRSDFCGSVAFRTCRSFILSQCWVSEGWLQRLLSGSGQLSRRPRVMVRGASLCPPCSSASRKQRGLSSIPTKEARRFQMMSQARLPHREHRE